MVLLEPGYPRRRLIGQLVWFVLWLGVTAVGLALTPNPEGHGTHRQLGLPACPSVLALDRPCPGCGLTTSFTATLHGQFSSAFRAHLLGPIAYGLFTLSAWLGIYGWWKGRRLVADSPFASRLLVTLGVIFFTFGAYRMITTTSYAKASDLTFLPVPSDRATQGDPR